MSFGSQSFGESAFAWSGTESEPPAEGDVLVSGLCGIDAGVIASSGGGHSGLHSIEAGFIS